MVRDIVLIKAVPRSAKKLFMKKIIAVLAAGLLTASTLFAGEVSEADKKWSQAVEKMIEKGTDKISTPDSNRADLAVELAKKLNRTATITKKEKTYEVTFSAAKSTTVAQNQ